MLTYELNRTIKTPLYEQLYTYIKNDILNGRLKANIKLPSKRNFATHLQISIITIEKAYDQLLAEGYIYTKPKRGYYVTSQLQIVPNIPQLIQTNNRTKLIDNKSYQLENNPSTLTKQYHLNLVNNNTPSHTFPFSIWAKLMRHQMTYNQDKLMTTSPAAGIYELRIAIAKHLQTFRNMNVYPEQIIIGAGTEYLYSIIINLFNTETNFCIENPGYPKLALMYQQQNKNICFASLDDDGISMTDITRKKPQVLHISPSHHFPTGQVTSIKRRQELLAWAAKDKIRYIIEDDYDSEFRLSGQLIPTLHSVDTSQSVIYMNTFAKSLSSTIRISYMVLPPSLLAIYHHRMQHLSSTVSNFEQYTLANFISKGYFDRHINRMRTFYRKQRQQIISTIKASSLYPYLTIHENGSGLHFLITLKTSLTDKSLVDSCQKHGIYIKALSDYYMQDPPINTHTFIINYSNLNNTDLLLGLETIKKII